MISSADLKTGIGRLIRYLHIVSDGAVIKLVPAPSGYWTTLGYVDGHGPVPRQRVEYGLLVLLTFCRWMLGYPFKPIVASFSGSRPSDETPYDRAFGCPLQFDQDFNGFLVSGPDMESTLSTAVPELAELYDHHADIALRRLGTPTTASRAQDAVIKRLQDGSPLRLQIATDLGLSEHTFQRRLSEEGTSFSAIVDTTPRQLARRYLSDPEISLSEIVYLLGYADQSPFHRACMRWFAKSPREYRDRLKRPAGTL